MIVPQVPALPNLNEFEGKLEEFMLGLEDQKTSLEAQAAQNQFDRDQLDISINLLEKKLTETSSQLKFYEELQIT